MSIKGLKAGHTFWPWVEGARLPIPSPSIGYAPTDQCLFWGMLLSGYRGAVTLLVPSHSGPTHPQSGNQVPVTLERGMGRESGLPLPPSKEADRKKAGRGLTRGDVRMGPQTSYLGRSAWGDSGGVEPSSGICPLREGQASCSPPPPRFLSLPVTDLALRKTSLRHCWRLMTVLLPRGRGSGLPSLASICLLPFIC